VASTLLTIEEGILTFPESVQRLARQRARGTCECTQTSCPHYGRCRVRAIEFHHKKPVAAGGDDELSNCQFLCKACHSEIHRTAEGVGRL
jgi:5-methylcytosine-specific restriction endonuclease McrA